MVLVCSSVCLDDARAIQGCALDAADTHDGISSLCASHLMTIHQLPHTTVHVQAPLHEAALQIQSDQLEPINVGFSSTHQLRTQPLNTLNATVIDLMQRTQSLLIQVGLQALPHRPLLRARPPRLTVDLQSVELIREHPAEIEKGIWRWRIGSASLDVVVLDVLGVDGVDEEDEIFLAGFDWLRPALLCGGLFDGTDLTHCGDVRLMIASVLVLKTRSFVRRLNAAHEMLLVARARVSGIVRHKVGGVHVKLARLPLMYSPYV